MSFGAAAVQMFAQQSAAHRAQAFPGAVDGNGWNLQFTDADGVLQKFRAAFTKLSTLVDVRVHGKAIRCTAVFMLPDSLGLSLVEEETLITHIPTGDVYEIVQIGVVHGAAAERRVLMRRQEP